MALVYGCTFPEDLYYWVEENVWARLEEDGTVTVGMTDVAQTKAGMILYARGKRPGAFRPRGKSLATVESGKWVGPVPSPFTAEVVETNLKLLEEGIWINREPYGAGWVARIKPLKFEEEKAQLLTGQPAMDAYTKKLIDEKFMCVKCSK